MTDDNLDFYKVEVARFGTDEFRTIAEGTSSVVNSLLGVFDPTLLLNDQYIVRVTAQDVNGLVSSDEIEIGITANAKLGNFHLEFTDLQIPVVGIPITITRVYDTLQANELGDFGYGWTLQAVDPKIRETRPVNPGGFFAASPFREGTRVYLTNPDGKRVGFTFEPIEQIGIPTPHGLAAPPFGPLFHPHFRPDPGVFDTLEVDDIPLGKDEDGNFRLYGFGFNYNPDDYRLITKDGTTYSYNQFDGLQQITDTNGNTLTFSDSGIVASSGQSIQFVRDAQRRIREIVDPAGNSLLYEYDANGDLVQMTDQVSNSSQYVYLREPNHYLKDIIDPLGNRAVRTEYDDDGRLIGTADALGNTSTAQFDLGNFTETVFDELGNPVTLIYDPRGNIVQTVDPLGATWSVTYDANDNIVSSTDPRGFTTSQTFDSRGNVTSLTDALNQTWEFTYNSFSKPLTATDPLGRTVQYVYDANGNLIELVNAAGTSSFIERDSTGRITDYTDNNGNTTSFSYGSGPNPIHVDFADGAVQDAEYTFFGSISRLVDANGNEAVVTYDELGRPIALRDPLGNSISYVYNGRLLTHEIDRLGRTVEYEYDSASRLVRRTNPHDPSSADSTAVAYVYNARNQVISEEDALGRITQYVYRDDGQLLSTTDALGGVVTYGYDLSGNQTLVVDANGHQTAFQYDALNRMIRRTNALGGVQLFAYDAVGNLTSSTDENGHTTAFAFDDLNQITQVTNALGGIETQAYDPKGNLLSFTDANQNTTSYQYNSRNWLVAVTDPAGGTRTFTHDAVGNRLSETDELGNTTSFGFDALNQLVQVVDPLGATTVFGYDAEGNRTSVRDPLGRTTLYTFRNLDQVASITDAAGNETAFAYDLVGNRVGLTDPLGQTTTFTVDALNRLIQQTDPLGRSQLFAYDPVGNLIETTDRNGRVRTFDYDELNRQIQETWWTGGVAIRTSSASYDPVGNVLTASDPDSAYAFTYDALNRVLTVDNTGTPGMPPIILTYGYDGVGNVTSLSDNLGTTVTSNFDSRNLLASRSWSGGGVDPLRIEFTYNLRGDRIGIDRYADLAGTQRIGSSAAGFDAVGQMTHLEHRDALGAVLASYDYFYNLAGELTQEIINGESSAYAYDPISQLTQATHTGQPNESYTLDANGNRVGGGYVIGPNNQILSDGTFNYAYDNEGSLIRKTEIATGKYWEFTWDHRNRMVLAQEKSSGGIILSEASYTYDVFDRRIAKTVDGQTLWTVYENNRIALPSPFSPSERNGGLSRVWADFDGSGQVVTRYLAGNGIDELLARYRPGQGTVWYLTDRLGTVRDLVDRLGALVNHVRYDSFGRVLSQTNLAFGDRFLFTGREFDPETGLYFYRARYFDPSLGRFISQDPIGLAGADVNLYRYASNNPLSFRDPSGLQVASTYSLLGQRIAIGAAIVAIVTGTDLLITLATGRSLIASAVSSAKSTFGQFIEAVDLLISAVLKWATTKEAAEVGTATGTAVATGTTILKSTPNPEQTDAIAKELQKEKEAWEKIKAAAEAAGDYATAEHADAQIQQIQNEIRKLFGLPPKPWLGG